MPYKTKNILIYTEPSISAKLDIVWKNHLKKYGQEPRTIYLNKEVFEKFKSIIPLTSKFVANAFGRAEFHFRGAEVRQL